MATMDISLPETLNWFVDQQVSRGGLGISSEYVQELIRKDQHRPTLRQLLLDGAASAPTGAAADTYFHSLRDRVRSRPAR